MRLRLSFTWSPLPLTGILQKIYFQVSGYVRINNTCARYFVQFYGNNQTKKYCKKLLSATLFEHYVNCCNHQNTNCYQTFLCYYQLPKICKNHCTVIFLPSKLLLLAKQSVNYIYKTNKKDVSNVLRQHLGLSVVNSCFRISYSTLNDEHELLSGGKANKEETLGYVFNEQVFFLISAFDFFFKNNYVHSNNFKKLFLSLIEKLPQNHCTYLFHTKYLEATTYKIHTYIDIDSLT